MARVLAFLLMAHLLIFLYSSSIQILAAESVNKSEIDRQALLSFKRGIVDDPLSVLSAWLSLDFCSCRGVTCGKVLPLRVISLELNSLQLVGTLSPSLANLTSLAGLDLGNNQFSGGIPEELGTLQQLQSLMLASNNLAGNIPASLGTSSSSLSYVNLAYNDLTGSIPRSLATCSSLAVLNLTSNSFSGVIPQSLFNGSSQLIVSNLGRNFFTGPIPNFHEMGNLQILNLAENNLSGSVPPSLGNVSSLVKILLGTNNLAGMIPKTISQIRNLSVLALGNNLFEYVPAEIYNISSLTIFDLGQNILTGRIPSNIGNSLPNLKMLIMSGNMFEGFIPASLANASKLETIYLSNNSLAGPVPSLGSLSRLSILDLRSNSLVSDDWAFIMSLKNCSNLEMLSVYGNCLDGNLPASVGDLSSNLLTLDLGNNKIQGTIPEEIGKFRNLAFLSLEQNSIFGEIPSSIANLSTLVSLRLSHNRLSGQITPAIGYLIQLTELSLDSNDLRGNIPTSLGQCNLLTMLNLSFNSLDGYIPAELLNIRNLFSLDLSNNDLTGSIPQQIGLLINLLFLKISYNHLSGQIPSSLGQCLTLSTFYMDNNVIDGMIPESFSNLKALQQIDLSQNNLTGPIPDFFNSFRTLEQLDLSYNNFVGPVPTSGYFCNSSLVILGGNTNLCSSVSMLALPVCPVTSKMKSNYSLIMLIVIPTIMVALFLFFIVTFTKKRAHTAPCYKETMKKVSYGDILKATNWFSPINKISSSHTGSIYIGRFEFDTDIVAIKVFHLNEHGSLNSFLMECEVLRNTRHRNLMKAVTVCSAVDLENNEFKAIIFDFMANGSVDMWVHPKSSHQETPKRGLSLGQRIRIAKDVASALDYMHNQLAPPLICDLKPANVLLDYDMTARVGDFGSANFLTSSLATTEGFAGIGGTIGYIAPEYGMGHKISTRCDVYSFGILLLEMLTGKRPTDAMFTEGMNLHKLVSSAYPNELCEVLDPHMSLEAHHACATLVMQSCLVPIVEVALLCSMESPKDRPEMQDVCARIFAINEAFLESW